MQRDARCASRRYAPGYRAKLLMQSEKSRTDHDKAWYMVRLPLEKPVSASMPLPRKQVYSLLQPSARAPDLIQVRTQLKPKG